MLFPFSSGLDISLLQGHLVRGRGEGQECPSLLSQLPEHIGGESLNMKQSSSKS